jgi:ketosteroid isomerase-like protein
MIARVEDHQEIVQLIYKYAFAIDAADPVAMVQLFVEDAEWVSPFTGTTKGREAIRRLIEGKRERNQLRSNETYRHFITNPVVEFFDGRAEVRASVLETRQVGDTIDVVYAGHYENTVVKHDGRWKFSSRRCLPDGTAWKHHPGGRDEASTIQLVANAGT